MGPTLVLEKVFINIILMNYVISLNHLVLILIQSQFSDKLYSQTNSFLTNRVFSSKIKTIRSLSDICIRAYNSNNISTVIKHIPGHGLSKSDSHRRLPKINKSINFLLKNDFKCFKNTKSKFAMTAHILFDKIDSKDCATHSKKIIQNIIRKKIGSGLLISDDISMKSLKYSLVKNALKALMQVVIWCYIAKEDQASLLNY